MQTVKDAYLQGKRYKDSLFPVFKQMRADLYGKPGIADMARKMGLMLIWREKH